MNVLAALQHGPVTIRYIRHSEAAAYRRRGWTVAPLPVPHSAHSMIAWRAG